MPDLWPAIKTKLTGNADVAAMAGERVLYGRAPQGIEGKNPCIVGQLVLMTPENHLLGQSDLARSALQLDCYGDAPADAKRLADRARMAINGLMGVLLDGVEVSSVLLLGQTGTYEPGPHATDTGDWREMLEFSIWHKINVPVHA